ncbi:MAG TPA: DUF1003 domain-containing protein [Terriglobales bacterium]|jgi:uncharacterized membrane protein|nr:DUF1003 domain-containing protein [Terriglobales bacterium]
MENPLSRQAAANPTQYNIDAIAKLENDALNRRTPTERVSDIITKVVGNVGFLLAQLILISGWSLVNLHLIPVVKAFDPFPFGVLALIVSSESVFLTIFVLISQSRMARQSERRSHLDLQVGMLSEQELTTILQMLQKLCQHMGVNVDSSRQEVRSFSKTTDVHKLASELEDKLPEE